MGRRASDTKLPQACPRLPPLLSSWLLVTSIVSDCSRYVHVFPQCFLVRDHTHALTHTHTHTHTHKHTLSVLPYVGEGVLVHCVSGWDRTPLFVSLLRISLWADGFVHTSLSAEEILYLTIAYDWSPNVCVFCCVLRTSVDIIFNLYNLRSYKKR